MQAVCRESKYAARLLPYFGRSIKANQRPMEEWQKQEGERRGFRWIIRRLATLRQTLLADANAWRSFFHARLSTPAGDPGSLSLFKPRLRTEHKMIAEHLRAENRRRCKGTQRELDDGNCPSRNRITTISTRRWVPPSWAALPDARSWRIGRRPSNVKPNQSGRA